MDGVAPGLTFEASGIYRQCASCTAPVAIPFPADWTLTIRRDPVEPTQLLMTPHWPHCFREMTDRLEVAADLGRRGLRQLRSHTDEG